MNSLLYVLGIVLLLVWFAAWWWLPLGNMVHIFLLLAIVSFVIAASGKPKPTGNKF